ncbi:MAG: glycosyltransferase family 1 protein [Pseudomonadota bacterium]
MALKILILSDAWQPQVNGVVRTYEHLGAALRAMGHEVRVVGPLDFPMRFCLPFYREIHLAIWPGLSLPRLMDSYRPDIVHIATEGPIGVAGRNWCLRRKQPFTTCYHTHFPDYVAKRVAFSGRRMTNWIRARAWDYLRWFHHPAKSTYVATASLEDALKDNGLSGPFRRLSRGVQTDLFHSVPRVQAQLPSGLVHPIALYVGRIAIEKNVTDFLDMDWPGSKVLAGTGPLFKTLRADYPAAHFVGVKSGHDLADLYRAADVFVFPSRTDTFGMVLIEAMACGLPIAAYNVPGPKDIVTAPALGCLDNNLAAAAHCAMAHSDRTARAAYAARTYNWNEVAREFLEGDDLAFSKVKQAASPSPTHIQE